jgi:DNA-binding transcriptional ArsR family regulator
MARPAVHRITKPAQWAKMMAPVRFELLEAMRAIAPCSAREIALALDRPADALYPHLRALVRVGVVRDMGERPGRTRPERVYDLVADDFRPSFKGSTRANTARVVDRSMRTMAGIVARTSRKSAAAGRIRCEPGRENVVGKVEHAWLTADEFAHVRRRIHSIKRYLDARLIRRDGALYMAAFFMVPVARSRGAAVSRKARTGAR